MEKYYNAKEMFPINSNRTFVPGTSRIAIMSRWLSDSSENRLKQNLDNLIHTLEYNNIEFKTIQKIIQNYKKIYDIYKELNKKIKIVKMYIFSTYYTLKNLGIFTNHNTIAKYFDVSGKFVCNALKEIGEVLYMNNIVFEDREIKDYIRHYIERLGLSNIYIDYTYELYEELVKSKEFNNHKKSVILAGILFSFNIEKETIKEVLTISDTTLYQINKKITKYFEMKDIDI